MLTCGSIGLGSDDRVKAALISDIEKAVEMAEDNRSHYVERVWEAKRREDESRDTLKKEYERISTQ